ncbi:hypothetical protein RCL1_003257 [Eukaryota sp. TZLM3-RCL]
MTITSLTNSSFFVWVVAAFALISNLILSVLFMLSPSFIHHTLVHRKVLSELRRKGFHINGLLYPSLYYIFLKYKRVTKSEAVLIVAIISIGLSLFEALRIAFPRFNILMFHLLKKIMRKKESRSVTGLFFFTMGTLLTILLFAPPYAILGCVDVVVGDLSAALVGVTYGKTRLRGKKTVEGTLGCFFCCWFFCTIVLISFLHSSLDHALIIALSSAFFATIAELFADVHLDDNLIMPVSGAFGAFFASWLLKSHVYI